MNYKTTKAHFDIFKKECSKWIKYFGLLDWEINLYHKKLDEEDKDSMAITSCYNKGKRSDITLNIEWDEDKPSEIEIKKCAFHEICEVLYYPIAFMAEARFLADGEIETETHRLIRILENTVFEESNA